MTVQETWSSVLSELSFLLWAEMDPTNRECLTSQAVRGSYPGKRYQRIRTCLPGEVESSSSPIRRQAPDVKYPEKVERRPDRITVVRYPDKVGHRSDRIAAMRHSDKVERWPGIIPDVRHPGGVSDDFCPGGMSYVTRRKGGHLRGQGRGSHVALFREDPTEGVALGQHSCFFPAWSSDHRLCSSVDS